MLPPLVAAESDDSCFDEAQSSPKTPELRLASQPTPISDAPSELSKEHEIQPPDDSEQDGKRNRNKKEISLPLLWQNR